jgi:pantoate--beta-alanine ligase
VTRLITDVNEWRAIKQDLRARQQSIGLVPTMGALHEGHLMLVRAAHEQNQTVVVTIFVNQTQFNERSDFEKYPRTLAEDVALLEGCGADYVLAPDFAAIYPDDYRYKVVETEESKILEGQHRPGHFDGVLTVVMKLFHLVAPQRAYFGEKDFQQLQLIKGMVEAFLMDVEIVPHPTIREADGLAMSSRNRRLSAAERALAAEFPKALREAASEEEAARRLANAGIHVEYIERYKDRWCGAVRIGEVRLIDNFRLSEIGG